jgi:hypothetical protein
MVCIANYDDNNEVIGCTREDGVSGGVDFLAYCEALGMTITYKTQEELDSLLLAKAAYADRKLISEAKATGEVYTLNGVDYQVPFMKDDADGLLQVKAAFDAGLLTETVVYFTNGTKMPITSEEFDAFVAWFVPKRDSFFTL